MWFGARPVSMLGLKLGFRGQSTRLFSRLRPINAVAPKLMSQTMKSSAVSPVLSSVFTPIRGPIRSPICSVRSNLGPSKFGLRMASTSTRSGESSRMSWSDFFKLRKRRRIIGFASSIVTAIIASTLAFEYFANLVIDFNKTIMGIEIQWIYLGGIAVSGFLGWIIGPFVGNQVFNILIGSSRRAFTEMDNVFLRHVARNRPNPVRHNVNTNPLPDYYGEKIGSLHDYRRWLREGRLFEKKATKFL